MLCCWKWNLMATDAVITRASVNTLVTIEYIHVVVCLLTQMRIICITQAPMFDVHFPIPKAFRVIDPFKAGIIERTSVSQPRLIFFPRITQAWAYLFESIYIVISLLFCNTHIETLLNPIMRLVRLCQVWYMLSEFRIGRTSAPLWNMSTQGIYYKTTIRSMFCYIDRMDNLISTGQCSCDIKAI